MIQIDLPLFSQFMAAILSCFFLIKKRSSFLLMLSLFLMVTFFVELIGAYYTSIKKPNFVIYHFYTFFEYVIIFFLYRKLIKDKRWLNVSKVLLVLFVVVWFSVIYDKFFFHYSIIIGSFNVGVLSFLYLRELLLSDKIINYKKLLPFWVSVGFLVFHLPAIPFFSFLTYMKNRELFSVLTMLIILMNTIISLGLIWSNKEVKY